MGLQDRDYIREKPQKNIQNNPLSLKSGNQTPSIKYLFYPVLVLAFLVSGPDYLLNSSKNRKTLAPEPLKKSVAPPNPVIAPSKEGGIVLRANRNGHYRGMALINHVRMPFMIDTGASHTTIPANLALAAGLPIGRTIPVNTAGGQVFDHMTQINSLILGNTEIKNLEASINQHIDEVLIGMNTLRHFHLSQDGKTLTLTTSEGVIDPDLQLTENMQNESPTTVNTPNQTYRKISTSWKKRVTCDEQKNCKTVYADH